MDRASFTELRIKRHIDIAFYYAAKIQQYREWIKQSRVYKDKLLYDSWCVTAETRLIEAANEIIKILEESASS